MSGERHIELFLDESGHWRWRIQAANGELVATAGEPFDSKQSAARAVPPEFAELPVTVEDDE